MSLQQISLGGASAPTAPVDATSQAAQGQTNSVTGLTMQQYLKDIQNTPFPVVSPGQAGVTAGAAPPQDFTPPTSVAMPLTGAIGPSVSSLPPVSPNIQIDPFTSTDLSNTDPNGPLGSTRTPGNPYEWDPFSFGGAGEGAALTSEKQSQGYQDFGQSWLDLLNTISTQNLKWGGTNDYGGELKGGGDVGPWLSQNILTPWNSGNQQDAYANSVYFISSQTGKPPNDPEVQKLGGAFLEYTLQNATRYGANTENFANRRASSGNKGILGDIESGVEAIASIVQPELAIPFAALNLLQGGIEGNLTPLSAVGDVLQGIGGIGGLDPVDLTNIAAQLGTVPSTLTDIASGANLASSGIGLGEGVSSGNLLQAGGGAVGLGTGLYNALPSGSTGTAGTNAPESGGVFSSVADSLGVSQDQLASYLSGGVGIGSAAAPAIQRATAGGSPTLNVQAPLPPPAPPPAQPSGPLAAAGQPLDALTAQNPSQATYQQPGPRQANPDLYALLAALGATA